MAPWPESPRPGCAPPQRGELRTPPARGTPRRRVAACTPPRPAPSSPADQPPRPVPRPAAGPELSTGLPGLLPRRILRGPSPSALCIPESHRGDQISSNTLPVQALTPKTCGGIQKLSDMQNQWLWCSGEPRQAVKSAACPAALSGIIYEARLVEAPRPSGAEKLRRRRRHGLLRRLAGGVAPQPQQAADHSHHVCVHHRLSPPAGDGGDGGARVRADACTAPGGMGVTSRRHVVAHDNHVTLKLIIEIIAGLSLKRYRIAL